AVAQDHFPALEAIDFGATAADLSYSDLFIKTRRFYPEAATDLIFDPVGRPHSVSFQSELPAKQPFHHPPVRPHEWLAGNLEYSMQRRPPPAPDHRLREARKQQVLHVDQVAEVLRHHPLCPSVDQCTAFGQV